MTPEEFTAEMLKLQQKIDVEGRHYAMDKVMCEVLRQLGYGDGVEVFKNTNKWYA